MDGGCISLWFKEPLTKNNQQLLLNFSSYIETFATAYSIRFREIVIKSRVEKEQIIKAISYIPTFEVLICGFADAIFLTAESILKEYGGYLSVGIDTSNGEFDNRKGIYHLIKTYKVEYHLLDWEYTSNYFNRADPLSENEIFSLQEFKNLQYFNKNNNRFFA